MKKFFIVILAIVLLLTLVGCDNTPKYTPDPQVEAYLNTKISGEKAYQSVATATYTVVEQQLKKDDTQLGSVTYNVRIDKSDAENLYLCVTQDYTGNYVRNGVTTQTVTISNEQGKYLRKTTSNLTSSTGEVDSDFVNEYLTSFFYVKNEAYAEGGLYYGDFFMLYIYRYPTEYFFVDQSANLCVFDGKMNIFNNDTGNVHLHQVAKINVLGLLEFNQERHESVDKDFVVTSSLTATYTYVYVTGE